MVVALGVGAATVLHNVPRDHHTIDGVILDRMSKLQLRGFLRCPTLAASLIAVFFALTVLRVFPDSCPSDSEQTYGVCQWPDECVATPPVVAADPVRLVVVGVHVLPLRLVPRATLITPEVSARAPPVSVLVSSNRARGG